MTIGISVVLDMVALCTTVYFRTIVHELGHYLPRKLFGIKTDVFIGPWDSKFYRVGDWWFSWPPPILSGGGGNFPGSLEVFDSWKYVVILLGGTAFNVLTAVVMVCVGVWNWDVFSSTHIVAILLLFLGIGIVVVINLCALRNLLCAYVVEEGKRVATWVWKWHVYAEGEIRMSDGAWIKLHFYAKHHPDEREKINVLLDDRSKEVDRYQNLVERREREGIRRG